jgi:hypothetical protein
MNFSDSPTLAQQEHIRGMICNVSIYFRLSLFVPDQVEARRLTKRETHHHARTKVYSQQYIGEVGISVLQRCQ